MTDSVFTCPDRGEELDPIGCEKTTTCETCGQEWKYADGMEELERVEENDPIYWDR